MSTPSFIKLTRPLNTFLPIVATVAGYTSSEASRLTTLILVIILFILLHGVITVWNDIEDEAGDKYNGITRIAAIRRAGDYQTYVGTLVGLTVLSLIVSFFLPLMTQLLLVSYLAVGWLYNAPPARFSGRPIGSMFCMWLAYGVLPFALGASLGHKHWQVLLLGFGWSLTRLSLSILKDYKDAPGDAKAGKKTFLLVYGNRWTSGSSLGLLLMGLASILVTVYDHRHGPAVAALGLLSLWLVAERAKLLKHDTYPQLHRVFKDGLNYQLIFDLAVIAWLRTS